MPEPNVSHGPRSFQRLKKEQHSMHEILMHCLVFLLHSATQLYCAPEEVIDIILESAEHLNGMLTSLYHQLKEGNLQLDPEKIHGVQRQWMLLQRLVIASSGREGSDFVVNINKICHNSQLLSIFADELAVIDYVIDKKYEDDKIEQSGIKQDMPIHQRSKAADQHGDQSFHVIYPDLSKFFPNLRKHFESFGENILEAVGLQLRSLSSSVVPNILCWFSDLCSWHFSKNQITSQSSNVHLKGYVAKTAKTIILYILEAIIIEHMEAMVPEIPRVVQVLVPHVSDNSTGTLYDSRTENHSWFLSDVFHNSCEPKISEELESNIFDDIASKQKDCNLSVEEIEDFSNDLENLIAKLNPNIELCWNLHHQLAKKLTITSAQCLMYSRCLSSIVLQVQNTQENESEKSSVFKPVDWFLVHWRIGLEALAEVIMKLQESHCWEVASLMLDCLLGVPCCFPLDNVINIICSVIKSFSCCAPKISWRLKSDKWFSMLFARGFHNLHESDGHLADLFVTLLGHPEPEQRFVVLQHLGRLVGQDMHGEAVLQSNTIIYKLLSPDLVLSVPESFLSLVVSSRQQLQSFLAAADSVLHVLGKVTHPTCEGPLLRLSLALIAEACLYSPAEDISLISQDIWRNIKTIGLSRTEGKLGGLEKNACEVLCRLRNEGDEAKENLKEVLSTNSTKQVDPDFGSTRESILQVLANLTSVQSCFDMFSKKIDQEAMELEEAEMELEILQKEHAVQESSKDSKEDRNNPWITDDASVKEDNRLQEIKDCIRSLEKSKLQEDRVLRRQKKVLIRRTRQKYLEEAAIREEELRRELDRLTYVHKLDQLNGEDIERELSLTAGTMEKAAEAEKEIERQRLLELECAKTRELRHNLDMEKERQTQARPFPCPNSFPISSPKVIPVNIGDNKKGKKYEISELRNACKKNSCHLETIALLEKKRDKIVLQLLLEAAELDRKFQRTSDYYTEGIVQQVIKLSPLDVQSTDAITLVRQNQALLCSFLIQRLKKEQHSMHEILMHCLVFLLHSATQLYCAPEEVIDIILESAEHLNGMLTSLYHQLKEGNLQLDPEKIHGYKGNELAVIDYVIDKKYEDDKIEQSGIKQDMPIHQRSKAADQHGDQSFHVIYPDLSYVAKTAKTIILYILEAIIIEHMEAMVPEIPRVVQVLVSLCRASYCCVSFLDSIIHLLKPIISYSLSKVSAEEKKLVDDSCLNFEALCFEELFLDIRQKNESQDLTAGKDCSRALTIFILASVFGDLSFQPRREILQSLILWADFTSFEPTTSFHDYLCAFQTVLESCKILLVKTLRVFGVCQLQVPHVSDNSTGTLYDSRTENHSWFLSDVFHNSCEPKISEELESNIFDDIASKQKDCNLSVEEIEDFSNDLENLIAKLNPNIELCWNLHHQLAKKLTIHQLSVLCTQDAYLQLCCKFKILRRMKVKSLAFSSQLTGF
uniref:Uncharacterized protein n=1 Tax=Salix viminalis TaxID=40686 RepID=A0A6N2N9G8_SALVM